MAFNKQAVLNDTGSRLLFTYLSSLSDIVPLNRVLVSRKL